MLEAISQYSICMRSFHSMSALQADKLIDLEAYSLQIAVKRLLSSDYGTPIFN